MSPIYPMTKLAALIMAVDNDADVLALGRIREKFPNPVLSVDLQENYKLAPKIAPLVNKIRYNPGHLFHLEKELLHQYTTQTGH